MDENQTPDLPSSDKPTIRVRVFTKITSKVSVTGIKNLVGSIFRFDSLIKVVAIGAVVSTGALVGDAASAWEILPPAPTAIEVIAIVQDDDGAITLVPAAAAPTILTRIHDRQDVILDAVLADAQTRIQIGTILERLAANDREQIALLEAILANQVPIGPPGKVTLGDVLEVVEDVQCTVEILQNGRACDHIPESITGDP